MKKITQKQMVFYKLYEAYKKGENRLIPTWEFVGEMFIKGVKKWVLMSYKCPTRLTELYQDNPKLIERKWVKGLSGAEYYGYKIVDNPNIEDLTDPVLRKFYKIIAKAL